MINKNYILKGKHLLQEHSRNQQLGGKFRIIDKPRFEHLSLLVNMIKNNCLKLSVKSKSLEGKRINRQ